MADVFNKATRSRIMRAIKSRDTGPELRMAVALRLAKVRFRRATPSYPLPGSPDFVFRQHRLAVFIHGCYWHLCRKHYKAPSGEGWQRKMDQNRRRDIRVRRRLRALGWATMVVWEHEVPRLAAARVKRRLHALRD